MCNSGCILAMNEIPTGNWYQDSEKVAKDQSWKSRWIDLFLSTFPDSWIFTENLEFRQVWPYSLQWATHGRFNISCMKFIVILYSHDRCPLFVLRKDLTFGPNRGKSQKNIENSGKFSLTDENSLKTNTKKRQEKYFSK